ncbi:hypothetical protein L596_026547 [Steinernema carpocapsae]|uniref:Uncharacterized protein n=1 Tax=Steinernema carpocapsae TaxID=34508 RepID=A0A4U5M1S0_STECR|nr:hypothetical protein L596_026547 [Steinernema carpocapsae]
MSRLKPISHLATRLYTSLFFSPEEYIKFLHGYNLLKTETFKVIVEKTKMLSKDQQNQCLEFRPYCELVKNTIESVHEP